MPTKRRVLVALALTFLITAGPTWAEAQAQPKAKQQTAQAAVFTFGGAISEAPMGDDFPFAAASSESFLQLTRRLNQAVEDDSVKAVVMLVSSTSLGVSQIEEVHRILAKCKQAKKPIVACADSLTMRSYLLVSVADSIYVAPTGDVFVNGIYGESPHLRGLLDKLNVYPDYTTCGAYKSAAEMFTRSHPSPEAAENTRWLIDGIFDTYLQRIAAGRGVDRAKVRKWIDQGLYSAERAQQAGIIDQTLHRQDVETALKKQFGDELVFNRKYGKKKALDIDLSSPLGILKFYSELLTGPRKPPVSKQSIAVVYVEGMIVPGSPEPAMIPLPTGGIAYSTPIRKALDKAAGDDSVKAVVLRVDSPGGSAVASEIILDATRRVASRKPLVVSMGNVAGSGGYYVACGSKHVFAESSTITGSIGVVAGKLATNGMWEKLGIHWDPVKRGTNAGLLSSGAPFTTGQKQALQAWMNEVYDVFKGHVEAIRGDRLKKKLDDLAGGRVYTGKQALELGLVDRLGGLNDAIKQAAKLSKVEKYDVRVIPRPKGFMELLLADLQDNPTDNKHLRTAAAFRESLVGPLWQTVLPQLRRLEPRRLRTVLQAIGQIELLQREHVLLASPLYMIGD